MKRLSLSKLSAAVVTLLASALAAPGCGPGIDREETLTSLRAALSREIPDDDPSVLREHNELVVNAREGAVLNGMRRHEVQDALGRGQECGARPLCTQHGFLGSDWVYEVGRRDGEAWGPTIIVGFDRQNFVEHVYTLTRE